jgi:hypothetical protein
MADEGRLREEIDRGSKAAALIRNPIFEEAFSALRLRYATDWANTPPGDAEQRERLYIAINVLEDIYEYIVNIMQTGELAGKEIDAERDGSRVH